MDYLRDPTEIYRRSFASIQAEADLSEIPADLQLVVLRLIHTCGIVELVRDLVFSEEVGTRGRTALRQGACILADCQMVVAGIIARRLPQSNRVICTLNDVGVLERSQQLGTTRSAVAVDEWQKHLEGAVVAIGNAPTALFRLLELLDAGAPKPAVILAFPVGFVGAADAKAALAAESRGVPFLTLKGRFGGSALAAAAVNALASETI